MIPDRLVGVHKRKALFHNEVLEESFDVTVTTGTAFYRRFQEIEEFFFS
ncbi:MAG: hypothetical protein IJR09_00270 [Paludibacteraceae bacterium]|nr:hypothetical protein [Paludibacteraceae bacterium]